MVLSCSQHSLHCPCALPQNAWMSQASCKPGYPACNICFRSDEGMLKSQRQDQLHPDRMESGMAPPLPAIHH